MPTPPIQQPDLFGLAGPAAPPDAGGLRAQFQAPGAALGLSAIGAGAGSVGTLDPAGGGPALFDHLPKFPRRLTAISAAWRQFRAGRAPTPRLRGHRGPPRP